ncbi:MAG: hypothetical protein ACE5FP_03850 [Gemmatimonadota bacterium]
MRVALREVAFARSGDKGDTANIGVIAISESAYQHLAEQLTTANVKRYFSAVCHGDVERYELPNLFALNFLLHESLGGGGTMSLMLDAQGKTFAAGILGLEIDVPEAVVDECRRVVAGEVPGRSPVAGVGAEHE